MADAYMGKCKAEEDKEALEKALRYKREVLAGYAVISPDGQDTVKARIELSELLSCRGKDEEAYKEAQGAYESCLKERVVNDQNDENAWLRMMECKLKLQPEDVDVAAELAKFIELEEQDRGEGDRHIYDSLDQILGHWIYEKNQPLLLDAAKKMKLLAKDFFKAGSDEYMAAQRYLAWEKYLNGEPSDAYKTLEQINDYLEKQELWNTHNRLCLVIVAQELGRNEECLKLFKEFEKDWEEEDDPQYILQLAAAAAARATQALGNKHEATRLFKRAIEIAEDRGDSEDVKSLQRELAAHQGKSRSKES